MSAPTAPEADFLAQKSTEELLFLARNPSLYHTSLVDAARRELGRRGQLATLAPETPAPAPLPDWEDESDTLPTWQRLALGGLVALALGGGLWWSTLRPTAATPPAPRKPPVLVSVETHQMPAFAAGVEADLKTLQQLLPADERQDTTATRKYLLLGRRFWTAEHQTQYLLAHLKQAAADSTLPGQVELVDHEWHRLTSVLVYNHNLQPLMGQRVELMRDVAHRRMQALYIVRGRYQQGLPLADPEIDDALKPVPNMVAELQGRQATIEGHLGE